jgi:heavy metal sensor kinase
MLSALSKLRPRTLRVRLLIWYTAVFGVFAVLLVALVYVLVAYQLTRAVEIYVQEENDEFVREARAFLPDLSVLEDQMRMEVGRKGYYTSYYRLTDAETGRPLLVLPDPPPGLPFPDEVIRQAMPATPRVERIAPGGRPGRQYLIRTVTFESSGRRYVIQSGVLVRKLDKRIRRIGRWFLIAIPLVLLCATAGGAFLAGRSLRPMGDIVDQLRRIRSSDLSHRLPAPAVHDEVGSLVAAINDMLEELEDSFRRIRSFSADAAHELRTPLATLICQTEVALSRDRSAGEYREQLNAVLEQAQLLAKVVQDLMFLAKTDRAGLALERCSLELAPLLREVADPFALLADEGGIRFHVEITGSAVVEGHREWLRILFANLLDNAFKYTPPRGSVTLAASTADGSVRVTVEDSGVGIPPEELKYIFDRFYRTDYSRSRETGGSGLGLSIAKRIVDLHRGDITVHSEVGQGSRFVVVLPERPAEGMEVRCG